MQNGTKGKESSQVSKVEDISNILEPIAKKYDIPSISGLFIKGDQIVMQGVTGVRKREQTLDQL